MLVGFGRRQIEDYRYYGTNRDSLESFRKDLNEIDDNTTSNLEVVSDSVDKIDASLPGLVKEFKDVADR